MTSPRSQQRRIALQTTSSVHDLALPADEPLGNALLALGLLPESRERILDAAGRVIDLDTRAEHLREGGVYAIATPPRPTHSDERRHDGDRPALAPWLVLVTALLGLATGITTEMRPAPPGADLWFAGLGTAALVALLVWGRSRAEAGYVWIPVVVLAGSVLAVMWRIDPTQPTSALATAMAAAAVGGAFITLVPPLPETRAMGGPILVISAVAAIALLGAAMLQWGLLQVGAVLGAMAGVGLRGVPYWVVKVDDGHHIDYARFVQVRWSVRGRMPEYLPEVDLEQVRVRVRVLETRLRVATVYLSALLAAGIWATATFLPAPTRTQRIAAVVALVCMVLGALLVSRRTASAALRTPPRVAAAAGLLGMVAIAGFGLEVFAGPRGLITTVVLLLAGAAAAGLALAIARGARSILWSRIGDIVEALAVALMVPAALVAVGTIDLLRGVFSG